MPIIESSMRGILNKYSSFIRLDPEQGRVVDLGEGDTPLLRLTHFATRYAPKVEIYAKVEGLNPTGSFKDRGMTVAVTQALRTGSKAIICASTGNTSASAAAYAARAGLRSYVLIPAGKIATGKLAQAIAHGARLVQISGNFDDAMTLVKECVRQLPITLVNSVNPYRLQGQKTAAFEIVDQLQGAPDFHCLPVGNAGNICAYWMGYQEYHQAGQNSSLPRICGYQAAGAAPFLQGGPVQQPETQATAIRIGNPQSWDGAWAAARASNGHFLACSDDDIMRVRRQLAECEGIFCEAASAISLAGMLKDVASGFIPPGSRVVCTLTGNGLKDADLILKQRADQMQTIEPTMQALRATLKLG